MNQSCQDSHICVDKPELSKLSQSMFMSGLYKQTEEEKLYPERPLYRSEFGRMTWKLLYRIATMYGDNPNEADQELMSKTIQGLSIHFPCIECKEHFKKEINIVAPKLENNKSLAKWLCHQHNQVNKRLGKPVLDCEKEVDKILTNNKI